MLAHLIVREVLGEAEQWAANVHVVDDEATASGRVLRKELDPGYRSSVAVPLVELDGPATLDARLLRPLLDSLD